MPNSQRLTVTLIAGDDSITIDCGPAEMVRGEDSKFLLQSRLDRLLEANGISRQLAKYPPIGRYDYSVAATVPPQSHKLVGLRVPGQ